METIRRLAAQERDRNIAVIGQLRPYWMPEAQLPQTLIPHQPTHVPGGARIQISIKTAAEQVIQNAGSSLNRIIGSAERDKPVRIGCGIECAKRHLLCVDN